jgi:superoxide dismutase, Cu-Zn family
VVADAAVGVPPTPDRATSDRLAAVGTPAAGSLAGDLMLRSVMTPVLSACAVTVLVGGCAAHEQQVSVGKVREQLAVDGGLLPAAPRQLTAHLINARGDDVGRVTFSNAVGGVQVTVRVTGLPPGFHGFHVHSVGRCEPNSVSPTDPTMRGDFLSAGGHIGAGQTDHPAHAGDLPVLLVNGSGTGTLTTVTDRLRLGDLTDTDGSAVIVHALPDNFANIPPRYAPGGPDQMTRNTGDSGGRIACGVVRG